MNNEKTNVVAQYTDSFEDSSETFWCDSKGVRMIASSTSDCPTGVSWKTLVEQQSQVYTTEDYEKEVETFVGADAALSHNRELARKRWERDYKSAGIGDFDLWWRCYFQNKTVHKDKWKKLSGLPWRGDDETWGEWYRRHRAKFYSSASECRPVTDHLAAEIPK